MILDEKTENIVEFLDISGSKLWYYPVKTSKLFENPWSNRWKIIWKKSTNQWNYCLKIEIPQTLHYILNFIQVKVSICQVDKEFTSGISQAIVHKWIQAWLSTLRFNLIEILIAGGRSSMSNKSDQKESFESLKSHAEDKLNE